MNGLRHLPDVTTLALEAARCNGCMMCLLVCPHDVFAFQAKRAVIADRDACMECGACARNCPEGALSVRPGVGCAAGIIMGYFRRSQPATDIGGESSCCD